MTIRLTSTTTALELVRDREPTNVLSAGDVIRARSTLRNTVPQFGRRKGSVVGRDEVVTMVASAEGNVRVTATLPGGTIRSSGKDRVGPDQALRVTGGTGRFTGARGVVEVRLLDARTRRALNVYRLQLP
jgi:Dirigent-like protein